MNSERAIEELSELRIRLKSRLNDLNQQLNHFRQQVVGDPRLTGLNLFEPTRNYLVGGRTEAEMEEGTNLTIDNYASILADNDDEIHELTVDTCRLIFELLSTGTVLSPTASRREVQRIELPNSERDREFYREFWPQLKSSLIENLGQADGAFSEIHDTINILGNIIGLIAASDENIESTAADENSENVERNPIMAALSVYTAGASDDRFQQVVQIAKGNETIEHRLEEIDRVWPIPLTAKSRGLAGLLGVSHTGVQNTTWWRNRQDRISNAESQQSGERLHRERADNIDDFRDED